MDNIHIPSQQEFIKGIEEFERNEKRDAMYRIATFLISHFWGDPSQMADGLGVLLLTWNQAFYRYGSFDFDELEKCIRNNLKKLEEYRNRNITSLSEEDEQDIKEIFEEFLKSLQIVSADMKVRKSPVAVAKALHLLAPEFFPLWDERIANVYGCSYNKNPGEKYIQFMKLMRKIVVQVRYHIDPSDYRNKTLLKLIDEYNYSKYTKMWI